MKPENFKVNIQSDLAVPTEVKVFIGLEAGDETLTQGSILVDPNGQASLEFNNKMQLMNSDDGEINVAVTLFYGDSTHFKHKVITAPIIDNRIQMPKSIDFQLT